MGNFIYHGVALPLSYNGITLPCFYFFNNDLFLSFNFDPEPDFKCLKNSIWARRCLASALVLYSPICRPLSATTIYFEPIFLIINLQIPIPRGGGRIWSQIWPTKFYQSLFAKYVYFQILLHVYRNDLPDWQ